VKKNGEYVIRFSELKEDTETFEFDLGKTFFQDNSSNNWESGNVGANVDITKRPDGISLDLQLSGELTVICDRCLDAFPYRIDTVQRLYVKHGHETMELDDDVVVVSRDENQIDLEGYFYEYLVLALPVKRTHPEDSNGESTCNSQMLNKLEEHIIAEDTEKTDPRWDDLKKLMDKN